MSPPDSLRRCRKCRSVCVGAQGFCVWCGSSLQGLPQTPLRPPVENDEVWVRTANGALAAIAGLGFFGLLLLKTVLPMLHLAGYLVFYAVLVVWGICFCARRPGAFFAGLAAGAFMGVALLVGVYILFAEVCKTLL